MLPEKSGVGCLDVVSATESSRRAAMDNDRRGAAVSPDGAKRTALLGRDVELSTLTDRLNETIQDHPTLVVVVGAGGIGKTALIQEFCRRQYQASIVFVAVEESERRLRFGLLNELLRRLAVVSGQGPADLENTFVDPFAG